MAYNFMFSFRSLEILIVLLAGILLFGGLALLALRRRNEILQEYLTPHNPDIEQEFFKRRPEKEAPPPETTDEDTESEEVDPMKDATWGTPGE